MSYGIDSEFNRTGNKVTVGQKVGAISLFTISLAQDFKLGPLHWDNVITYQKSSDNDVIPLPDINIYSNLYLRFKIARVLKCDIGADVRYFTKYYAPTYSPLSGTFATQDAAGDRVKVGNYPIINLYANLHLQRCRLYVMASHLNETFMTGESFLVPHYPINPMTIKFGISWTFHN